MSASDTQVGGKHYKEMVIQPFEYIQKNGIGFAEGCVIKYVSRWRRKGGIEDLRKARHFLDLLIEAEGRTPLPSIVPPPEPPEFLRKERHVGKPEALPGYDAA